MQQNFLINSINLVHGSFMLFLSYFFPSCAPGFEDIVNRFANNITSFDYKNIIKALIISITEKVLE